MRRRSSRKETFDGPGRLGEAVSRHPREFVGLTMGTIATFAIVINALFLQKGPHPAPIFATRPLLQHEAALPSRVQSTPPGSADASMQARTQTIANIQRELTRKGFYDGPADGIWGAKTDVAVRDFAQAAGMKINPEAGDGLLRTITASNVRAPAAGASDAALNDPIAKLIAPSKRVTAIQRALAEFGYGQIKPTGVYDPETRTAIEKFERDRRLPVTGQISDRFVRELAAMTGRPLE